MKCRAHTLVALFLLPALVVGGCSEKAEQASAPPAAAESESEDSPRQRNERGDQNDLKESQPAAQATAAASAAGGRTPKGRAVSKRPMPRATTAAPTPPGNILPGPRDGFGERAPHKKAKPKRLGLLGQGQEGDEVYAGDAGVRVLRPEVPQNMFFKHYGVNPTIDTVEQAKSTFAVDVDNASYTMARSFLERGQLPKEAAVRVEEIVNAFDYGYKAPSRDTFAVHAEAAPSPNRSGYHLLHVGLKGREVAAAQRKAANLVFVIDVSGSMSSDNRLGLVKRSLRLLVGQLKESDTVGIVTYGSKARELLQPTSAHNKQRILGVISNLRTEGATNAEAGIRLGYAMAARQLRRGAINRVVLCSDGVANVGRTGPNSILQTVSREQKRGITITTVGFGMGNYNDTVMEQLANRGNGNYYYVDKLAEARRVFVDQLGGTLQVIAKDVKIQVDFDPKVVARYRLIGYENRALKTRDFDDDRVDAGEIGAGHSVTALYEIKLRQSSSAADIAKVRVRFKAPSGSQSRLIERAVPRNVVKGSTKELSSPSQLSLIAAQFAEKMRGSYWARNISYEDILERFSHISSPLRERADTVELRRLVAKARDLDSRADKFKRHGPVAHMDFDRVPVLR